MSRSRGEPPAGLIDGAIGRAERMAGMLLDASRGLSELVNKYKLEEINGRIAEIGQSDLSDPKAKKRALADVVRLSKIADRLNRKVRHEFHVTTVKGE